MNQHPFPQALTIAGSDSGGGAGIQADLKTFQERHVFGLSVLTAVTAQNTLGVSDIHAIPQTTIAAQLAAIAEDFHPAAFKIGMLGDAETITTVANFIAGADFGLCVLDPVMIAKGGAPLLQTDAIDALKQKILPLADVLTPNIPEAETLTGLAIADTGSARKAAEQLQILGAKTVIIKGGHAKGDKATDWVFMPDKAKTFTLSTPRIDTPHTHGTGCTFSACITAELAKGNDVETAIRTAKDFISVAIAQPLGIGGGHGPVNHWAYAVQKQQKTTIKN